MFGSRSGRASTSSKDSSLASPPRTRGIHSQARQLPSPPHRRSSSRSNNSSSLLLSPTFSSFSSISSTSPDLGLLDQSNFSPSPISTKFVAPPSPVSVSRDFMDVPFTREGDTSPTLTATLKGKGRASMEGNGGAKNQRQTKIQEHLKSGKPGPSPSSLSRSKSSTTPVKRGRKPAVVVNNSGDHAEENYRPIVVTKETLDLNGMSEQEAQVRLGQEKYELMRRLADYGLSPESDVLDNALSTIDTKSSNVEGNAVQSFLQAVSSQSSKTPRQTETIRKPRQSVTFSVLESPVTDSSDLTPEPRTPQRSTSTRNSRSSNPNHSSSYPTSILSTPTATLAPSPDILLCTPSERRNSRVSAFSHPRSNSMMVAAELQGMGRVAMSKDVLFERLGMDTAEKAIVAASDLPSPSLLFGHALPQLGSPIIDAFSSARRRRGGNKATVVSSSSKITSVAREEETISGDDKRIGLVRAWLDSPEMLEDESREGWSTVPKEWSDDVFSKGPFIEELVPVEEDLVRGGGGKSVRGLVKTKRRRFEHPEELLIIEDSEVEIEDDDVSLLLEDEAPVARYSSTKKKGKGKAEGSCICNETEEAEGVAMVRCDDCSIWYHLECLDIPSAKQLGKEWFCFRCSGAPPPLGPSPSKRTKMIPPTTPILYNEPILVPSAFSPRPKGNFYRSSAADMVLAPSPQSSPIRRPIPLIAPPTTPQGIHSSRTDYSPRSPLRYRNTRSRVVSGSFEEGNQLWDNSHFNSSLVEDEHHHHPHTSHHLSVEEEARVWHDVTMTPSRSLSSSAFSWGETSTPVTRSRGIGAALALGTSASQDFLSGLHGLQQHQELSSRLPQLTVPSSSSLGQSTNFGSPLGPRNRPLAVGGGHQRKSSLPSNFFHPSASSSKNVPQGIFNSPDRRVTSASRTSHYQTVASPRGGNTIGSIDLKD